MLRRPAPFSAYTTPDFWNDPHVSARMLECHLAPDVAAASRTHAFIDRSARWLVEALDLDSGSRLLDLGCGPGLYANRIAGHGVRVLGIDVSRRSLAHAEETARARSLPASYRCGDYLECDLGPDHDAAILVYEDYCALSPEQRAALLSRVRDVLRSGGRLLFDVTSAARFAEFRDKRVTEPDLQNGFWAQPPYLGTHETWTYPELRLVLERYTIEKGAQSRQFWIWTQCLTPDEVAKELDAAGFAAPDVFGDVAGGPYDETNATFAVRTVAR